MTDLTVILPAFRQESFIELAVHSLLNQTGVTAQLILSDDASEDRTFDRIKAVVQNYHGPHEIVLNRNTHNLGLDHVAYLVTLASNDLIVMAHGDDIAEPHRCQRVLETFQSTGATVITSNASVIDANGDLLQGGLTEEPSHWITAENVITEGMTNTMLGAVLAWHRDVYRVFPPLLSAQYPFAHDLHIVFRGTLLGGTKFLDEPLLKRRFHAGQWTHTLFNNRTTAIRQEYLQGGKVTALVTLRRDFHHWRSPNFTGTKIHGDMTAEKLENLFNKKLLMELEVWMETRMALGKDGLMADWSFKHLKPGAQWSWQDRLAQRIQSARWQWGIWRRRWLGR